MAGLAVNHTIPIGRSSRTVFVFIAFSPLSLHTWWLLAIGYGLASFERFSHLYHEN